MGGANWSFCRRGSLASQAGSSSPQASMSIVSGSSSAIKRQSYIAIFLRKCKICTLHDQICPGPGRNCSDGQSKKDGNSVEVPRQKSASKEGGAEEEHRPLGRADGRHDPGRAERRQTSGGGPAA